MNVRSLSVLTAAAFLHCVQADAFAQGVEPHDARLDVEPVHCSSKDVGEQEDQQQDAAGNTE